MRINAVRIWHCNEVLKTPPRESERLHNSWLWLPSATILNLLWNSFKPLFLPRLMASMKHENIFVMKFGSLFGVFSCSQYNRSTQLGFKTMVCPNRWFVASKRAVKLNPGMISPCDNICEIAYRNDANCCYCSKSSLVFLTICWTVESKRKEREIVILNYRHSGQRTKKRRVSQNKHFHKEWNT